MAAVTGVTGLAFEARIAAGRHTRVICGGDGRMLAASIACAIAGDCRGLISFGIAGGLSPDLRTGTCVVGSTIVSETTQFTTDRNWSRALLLVGSLSALIGTTYGELLLPKLGLFGLMLCLAASNRFWLVPALAKAATISQSDLALARLRRNILAEQILGVLVVGIVSLLGTLSPAIQGS